MCLPPEFKEQQKVLKLFLAAKLDVTFGAKEMLMAFSKFLL